MMFLNIGSLLSHKFESARLVILPLNIFLSTISKLFYCGSFLQLSDVHCEIIFVSYALLCNGPERQFWHIRPFTAVLFQFLVSALFRILTQELCHSHFADNKTTWKSTCGVKCWKRSFKILTLKEFSLFSI